MIIPDWPAPRCIRAAVTTRTSCGSSLAPYDRCNLGLRSGDVVERVSANRIELMSRLLLPSAPRWLQQVHGTEVASFHRDDPAPIEVRADASTTCDRNVVLAVLTADCLPVLVCGDDGVEIAAIHAGWRGLSAGVIERSIEKLHTPRDRLLAWLGPAIGPQSYEVGTEVYETFVRQDVANAQAFVPTRPQHWLCDLYLLARRRLSALGVTRVYGGDFDTFADRRFYSYRREPVTGRFASLIWRSD